MERKTSELTGAALRYAVAKCEGRLGDSIRHDRKGILRDESCRVDPYSDQFPEYEPDADWSQGGPIIERERIDLIFSNDARAWEAVISLTSGYAEQWGETALIAAMRCYVASRLGDTVTIPDELC